MLMLTRGERAAASSRIRSYQFVPWFERSGIEVTVAPLLTSRYVQRLYRGYRPEVIRTCGRYCTRIRQMLGARRFEVLWVEQEVLPWMPAWCDVGFLGWADVPTIIDYDDAVYERYGDVRSCIARRITHNKIERVMRSADVVIAGNEEIARHAENSGTSHVEIIPSVVDPEHYDSRGIAAEGLLRICWVGTPITSRFLGVVKGPLSEFCREARARLTVIGAPKWGCDGLDVEHVEWSEETEGANISRCSIGIMPLSDGPFERGKCGYKLLQYMACGLPVIASPIGVNRSLVKNGVNGFLASTPAEWLEALRMLSSRPELRREMGRSGRELVEKEYSIQVAAPRLVEIVNTAKQIRLQTMPHSQCAPVTRAPEDGHTLNGQ